MTDFAGSKSIRALCANFAPNGKQKCANLALKFTVRKPHYEGMEQITAEWLKSKLAEQPRGARARLAEHMGIDQNKLTKVLSGTRKIQAEEIPSIMEFFNITQQQIDDELAAIWLQLSEQGR